MKASSEAKLKAKLKAMRRAMRAASLRETTRNRRRIEAWKRALGSDWRAIQVGPSMEFRAVEGLRQNEIDAYLPAETIWRRDRRTGRKFAYRLPLFRGYVFAEIPDARLHLVHGVVGAVRVVAFNGAPVRLDPEFVGDLRAHDAAGKFDKTLRDSTRRRLAAGQDVRVTSGKFAGWIGSVVRMSGERRVRLLLTLFGRQTETEVSQDEVEALEAA